MGASNRQRRAAKRRRQHHSGRGAAGTGSQGRCEAGGPGRDDPWPSDAVAQAALLARMEGDAEVFEQLVSTPMRIANPTMNEERNARVRLRPHSSRWLPAAGDAAGEEVRQAALPVLARRAEEVDAAIADVFPHVYRSRVGASHRGGYLAGRLAADRAHLASAVLPSDQRAAASS